MITLVSICSPEFMNVPPLGILYVGNALKKAGYEVKVLHFPPSEIDKYADLVASENPLFVGMSAFTSNQTTYSARFSREIKKRCDSPIVWGGVHASILPEATLSESYVDLVVIGEGEETIAELAEALETQKDLGSVKSIGYKRDGELVFTEARPLIKNLDEYKLDWDLIDIEKYLIPMWGRKRVISFITSRGCPYRCGFCYNMKFNRGRWRAHSKEFVIAEIKNLKERYGVDGIRFYDDNFFANKKRAIEILEATDIPWEGQLRIGYITDELARKIRDTKCQGICFGFESGNDRILELVNKDQTVEDIIRGTSIMEKYPEVRVSGCFILANPTETRQEIRNTINLCLKLLKIHPRMGFSLGVFLPFPGVPLYDFLLEEGFVPPRNTEGWEIINRTNEEMEVTWLPWVTRKDRRDFARASRYAQLLPLGYLKIPVINRIAYWRLERYNFRFPLELRPLEWVYRTYADESDSLGRMMRKVLGFLRFRRREFRHR